MPLEPINDTDELYRRILSFHINPDGTMNSAAYKSRGHPDQSISVDLARLTTPQETQQRDGRASFGVGVIMAGEPRQMGFEVRHDPTEGNPAHSLIEGQNDRTKCRLLAERTRVLISPPSRTP